MQFSGLKPDAFTFPSVLTAVAGLSDIGIGRSVHHCVSEMGFCSDLCIGNSLINMYARLGSLGEARNVFDGMAQRDIISWNTLIAGYSANGEWVEAAEVYGGLRMTGITPDCFTVESVLLAYGGLGSTDDGHVIHGLVHKIGVEKDRLVSNGLISLYCRFEDLYAARRIFDTTAGRDNVSWNTMMDGYYQFGSFEMAMELFREMVIQSKPDLVTITIVLHACHHMEDLHLGCSVHAYIVRYGYRCDVTANNILIAMYSKSRIMHMSRKVFDHMLSRDCVSWNSLIKGYVEQGCFSEATDLFNLMRKSHIKPDSVTTITLISICTQLLDSVQGMVLHCDAIKSGSNSSLVVNNALLGMYSKCDKVDDAQRLFERMESCDVVSWNSIISGCVHNRNCILGFKLLSQMKVKGVKLDRATMLGILPACSFLSAKRHGKEIHCCILRVGLEHDIAIGNAMIEMYSKCGSLSYAVCIFRQMNSKDIVTWTAMVSAYGLYGHGEKALSSFKEMEEANIVPDHVTLIAVLYACSHAGLVMEGKEYFNKMERDYKIMPRMEHYACMIDLLSRSGAFVEAEKFISSMPIEPNISIWGSLLSACQTSGELKMAERVAKKIMAFDSDSTGCYILASNLYAYMGKWDVVGKIRKSLKAKKLKKDPGYSWIEIRNKVHVFGTGDQLVEQAEEVHRLLEKLGELMAKEGYIPDGNFVLHNVEEDDKGYMLCTHSERLAIAFGLLNTKPGTPLQIMKNLRVCRDCHTATKYISKIVQREFLVRDANRFHLFKDGLCSCGDYW